MNDTRNEIIRLGSELIRSIGYNAFSYADISKALGIKNAAIHYYFPSKSDLGVEIIQRNIYAFKELVDSWKKLDYRKQFYNYVHMHDSFVENHWVCVVGALSPSFDTFLNGLQTYWKLVCKPKFFHLMNSHKLKHIWFIQPYYLLCK